MELIGERLIPAPVDVTWAALNDPEVLKACVAGCETLEKTGDDAYSAVVALRIGPVSARFKGNLKLSNIEPPSGYTIVFDGQGGVAGFGKGSADVSLTPEGEATRLKYAARAQVGGKMAQIGSRLIDAAAGKITEDFFKAFEARVASAHAAGEAAAPAASSDALPASSSDALSASSSDALPAASGDTAAAAGATGGPAAGAAATAGVAGLPSATGGTAEPVTAAAEPMARTAGASPAGTAPAAGSAPRPPGADEGKLLWWLIGGLVVLAVAYFAIR